MLSLVYLIPASVKESFSLHPMLMLAADTLNTIFFFCAAVAIAAGLDVHSCGNDVSSSGQPDVFEAHSPRRPMSRVMGSLTGQRTLASDAEKPKRCVRFSGSASLPLQDRYCSRLWAQAVHRVLVEVSEASEEAGHRCHRFEG